MERRPRTPRRSGAPCVGSPCTPARATTASQRKAASTQATPPAFERDYPQRSQDQFSPKLAAVATLAPEATLRLSYGEGFRAPTLLDLYSRAVTPGATAGTPVVTEPAPHLGAERVRSLEIGVDATLPTRTRTAVSLFAQRLGDPIYRQRVTPALNVVTNAGEAKIEGVEVEVAQPLFDGKLHLTATATHLFRYDITHNDAVPASVGKRLTDVPQSLYAIGLEGALNGWSGSFAWRYASHVFGSGDDQNRNTVQGVRRLRPLRCGQPQTRSRARAGPGCERCRGQPRERRVLPVLPPAGSQRLVRARLAALDQNDQNAAGSVTRAPSASVRAS